MKPKRKMAFWRKEAPKDTKPTKLTPKEKGKAKARAKAAGRRYPNLVDSVAVLRNGK